MTSCKPVPAADTDRVPTTYEERNTWLMAILVPATSLVYFAVVIPRLWRHPAAEVAWVTPMLWAMGVTFAGTILGSIVSAMVARDSHTESDVRDREIVRHGDRIAQGVLGVGAAVVLVLAMVRADQFWIGNALFLLGAVGTTWGAIAKIRAYRGAFHG
ncbi:hypothetical protein Cme02nite_74590 [Catellatospora methionotrophica]|uniref:Uncharacterized protein n=1 Tax=Catellatospora methionotrophica TaxID=121620 RepID=A0A8J3PJ56_9ACTN|nr:hypothetical protein [Catellatospora methionotrophica]GIG19127.1 hypothetical protein Cme02nite_74590 [Catellatospora methionotrophica]